MMLAELPELDLEKTMPAKDEVAAAIRAVDERLALLRDRILSNGETPLAECTWRVRDALSHLAARSNGVERVVRRAEQAWAGQPMPGPGQPGFASIDDINAGQVAERTERSVEDLLNEIATGHAAAIEALNALEDGLLDRMMPQGFRPGEAPVGELIIRGGPGHDQGHIDQIEAVLPPA